MKKIIYILIFCLLFIPNMVFAEDKELNIYLFFSDSCPHCRDLNEYLDDYTYEHKNIIVHKYEVTGSVDNANKLKEVQRILKTTRSGVPFLVIGNSVIVGYDDEITPERIKNSVTYYSNTNYKDEVGIYLGVVEDEELLTTDAKYVEEEFKIPALGKMKATEVPLLLSAVIIGLVDGFNPCAMWILIFLISMLLGMKDKKRKWILGIVFLLTSAAVYFLFLISWLNLAQFLNKIIYIRLGIAMIAVTLGIVSIVRFIDNLQSEDGCDVVDSKGRRRIINSIKKIIKEKSFFLAILGIMILAASVNIIELMCSLGLPVMFSEILSLNNVNNYSKIVYSLIYIFFFLIDDIIVFIVAMKTMEIKVISTKYGKYSHLIGGLIMLTIGMLMILKPEWIMFN